MSEFSIRQSRAQRRAMKRLLNAITKPTNAEELSAAHEAIFRSPLPAASEEDLELGQKLCDATLELLEKYGRQLNGPGRVRRKFTTPDGVAITLKIIAPTPSDDFVEARITAKHAGHNVLTLQIRQHGGSDGHGSLSTSYFSGPWIEPYLAYWKTKCLAKEGEK